MGMELPGGTPSSSTVKILKIIYSTPGQYDVTLIVSNALGADTFVRSQFITAGSPTATLSGNYTIAKGYSANLRIDFTGIPPYTVVVSHNTVNDTLNNITATPFIYNVSPDTTTFIYPHRF